MLDKTVSLDEIRPGGITRASGVGLIVGGKGVNVARQLTRLGVEVLATGLLGGEIGLMLRRLMDEESLRHEFYSIAALTREGVTYRTSDGTATGIFEPPHQVTPDEAQDFLAWLRPRLKEASWLVCSGSSPCPSCDTIYRELIREAGALGIFTVLDSYGTPFKLGLEAHPTLVKPNRSEYEQSFGRQLRSEDDFARALRELLRHAARVVITDGASPCYAGSADGLWRCTPPPVSSVNPTGSGDSMIAGILSGLARGQSFEESLRFGAAAGAANASVWAVGSSTDEEIRRLLPEVRLERLA